MAYVGNNFMAFLCKHMFTKDRKSSAVAEMAPHCGTTGIVKRLGWVSIPEKLREMCAWLVII